MTSDGWARIALLSMFLIGSVVAFIQDNHTTAWMRAYYTLGIIMMCVGYWAVLTNPVFRKRKTLSETMEGER